MSLLERFADKIELGSEVDSCWEWIACKDIDGYGRFAVNGKSKLSHKFSYELYKGKTPEGLELDHLCRNRSCVNPEHLEAVTSKINLLRGNTIASKNKLKTRCIHGHEYNEENTGRQKSGRYCKECDRTSHRKNLN